MSFKRVCLGGWFIFTYTFGIQQVEYNGKHLGTVHIYVYVKEHTDSPCEHLLNGPHYS